MKKIGILTTFGGWDEAYSPVNVVSHHLEMLKRYGYSPVLFTLDVFPQDFHIEGVEIRRVLPTTKFEPYHGITHHKNVPNDFEKDLARIVPAMEANFKDIDIMLCHDVIFQDSFLPYNAALHKMVHPKQIKYYHWMHSGPSLRQKVEYPISCLYSLPPKSKLVYMNRYDVVRAAEMYSTFPEDVRTVHNPIDYRLQKVSELTDKIISDYGLNDADVVAIYPLSTTRMGAGGKQLHKAIKVMAGLKKLGLSVRLIVPNAHANGQTEKLAIEEMRLLAKQKELDPRFELVFTSLIDKKYEGGIPHDVVVELIRYSDIFLFPSVSENCPLILLEAALGKNLMVLNEDFSPMKDFLGPNALYFHFDSVTTTTSHEGYPDGEDGYFNDVAKIINAELANNKTYLAFREIKRRFNIDHIFKNQLEPLFFEEWNEKKTEVGKGIPLAGDQDMMELPPQGMPDILEGGKKDGQ